MDLKPEELASLPIVKAYWSHSYRDYDIWLSARERTEKGLLWIFECPHGRWLLVGVLATVHGPDKKKWHQGVIKLPQDHKQCQYKLYPETEWSLVEEDPLRHFESVPIKYKGLKWYYGDIDVYLKAVHTNYTATLFITKERQMSHVTFEFSNFELFIEPFEVDYKRALDIFYHLYRNGMLEEDIPSDGLYNSYIPPVRALEFL